MTFKNVKSTNPVKRPVMEALKAKTGGNKVTNVQESELGFRANVHKHMGNRKYQSLGSHEITKEELTELGVLPLDKEETEEVVTDSLNVELGDQPASSQSVNTPTEDSSADSNLFG